jgi:ribosomal protein S18 acetylase RimI-like enzyme
MIRGIGGAEFVFTKRLDRLSIGELWADDFEIDGILGVNFLIRGGGGRPGAYGSPSGAMTPNVALRPVEPGDEAFLYRVYASTREEELAQTGWDETQKAAFLRMQFDAQRSYYEEYYRGAEFSVILSDDHPVGRLYVARWQEEIRIVDIALLPRHRGMEIGTRLLNDLISESEESGKLLSIHVERFNPALRLYERLGFHTVADKGVYLLMQRPSRAR